MINRQLIMSTTYLFNSLILTLFCTSISFSQGIGFDKVLKEQPNAPTTFCINNSASNRVLLEKENILLKYSSANWLFITTTPTWISDKMKTKELNAFHFEFAPPALLNDSMRGHHSLDSVHIGVGGLTSAYTGKNVLIGFVDTGLDYNHPDFLDANGKTRVLKYWDHSLTGPNSPMPYNYGQEWDSTDINNGTITSMDNSAHGTTVAGCAVGNGMANGTNKGVAPDANIVIVETNFNLSNWTLTVADACDYIFKIADEHNMPAVVNLSIGSYLGSHDGNDPASEYMEGLINAQPGRIIVCAAGNSGQWGKYHVNGTVSSDTTFTWFENNPAGQLGANTIYFDYWTDTTTAHTIDFAFGADKTSPNFTLIGTTSFQNSYDNFGVNPIYDTIFNFSGQQIAAMEIYKEIEGPNFHMEILFTNVDSTSYFYRFMTKGSGNYDLWSGTTLGLNNIVSTGLPTIGQMPAIAHYQAPDSLQTIVSSWNCSEMIISTANARNRAHHIDKNGNLYTPFPSSVGQLSPNSAKGPSRLGVTKPDITAHGDVSLSAGPLWMLNDMASWSALDSGGWHVRNGGTSMASPVITGIAALYLEKCPFGTYSTFKTLLTSTAYTDGFTGVVPNNAYGFGKANALDLLLTTAIEPVPTISQSVFVLSSSTAINYQWQKDSLDISGATNQDITLFAADGFYQVYVVSTDGCPSYSAPFFGVAGLNDLDQMRIKVYPNPTAGQIGIESDENILKVQAIDMLGKSVKTEQISEGQFIINEGAPGTYLLDITTKNDVVQLKIIIQ